MSGKPNTTPIADRLVANSKPDPASGCINWLGSPTANGYGLLGVNGGRRYAHRLAYECHVGAIPPGMSVCHRCDNPLCINVSHMFLGSQADNIADMVAKGRQQKGERQGHAKLTAEQVLAIRAKSGLHSEIAARHGVCRQTVSKIKRGDRWRHL